MNLQETSPAILYRSSGDPGDSGRTACACETYTLPAPLPLYHLLSRGQEKAVPSQRYMAAPSDALLLIYTVKGQGALRAGRKIHSLRAPGSNVLLLNTSQPFQMSAVSSVWEFQYYFLQGAGLHDLLTLFCEPWGIVTNAPVCSALAELIQKLAPAARQSSTVSALTLSGLLYQIVIACIASQLSDPPRCKFRGICRRSAHSLTNSMRYSTRSTIWRSNFISASTGSAANSGQPLEALRCTI